MKIIPWIKSNKYLLILVVLGAIFRFYKIDFQSAWLDEIHTLNEADPQKSLSEVYQSLLIAEPHPPLYFFLLHIIFQIFGYTMFVARSFSAILGVAGIFSIYFLGKEFINKKVGLYAAILVVVNYFHLYYSQDARMYSLMFLTATMSFIFLIRFIKVPTYKSAILFGLFSTLMIYSHFFALFVLVSQCLILLIFIFRPVKVKRMRFFTLTMLSGILILLLYLPSYGLILKTTEMTSIWIQMPPLDAYNQIFKDFFGQSEFVIICVLLMVILYFIKLFDKNSVQNFAINPIEDKLIFSFVILFTWILITMLLPLIRTYTSLPMLVNRYFIALLPAIIILVSIGLYYVKSSIVRYSILSTIVLFSITDIIIVKNYFRSPNKTQFREVSQYIIKNNDKNNPVVTSLSWYFPFFLNNETVKNTLIDSSLDAYVNEMIQDSTKIKSFWYVDAHGRPFKVEEVTQQFLDKNFFVDYNINLYDAWTKHYNNYLNDFEEIDISKFYPLKSENGDEIIFWIEDFLQTEDAVSVTGWAFLDGQNAMNSKIEPILIKDGVAIKLLVQRSVRKDVTSSLGNDLNLDDSGFFTKFSTDNLKKGNYTLAISVTNTENGKQGLVVTDKIVDVKK